MKKLTLLAAVAAMALVPAIASADYNRDRDNNDFKVRVQTSETRTISRAAGPQTFSLADGGRIIVEGKKIFLVSNAGAKNFAPNGPYKTTHGVTYYAEDGLVLRAENPAEMVYVDADFRDTDRDGYRDDVDIDVKSRAVR